MYSSYWIPRVSTLRTWTSLLARRQRTRDSVRSRPWCTTDRAHTHSVCPSFRRYRYVLRSYPIWGVLEHGSTAIYLFENLFWSQWLSVLLRLTAACAVRVFKSPQTSWRRCNLVSRLLVISLMSLKSNKRFLRAAFLNLELSPRVMLLEGDWLLQW